MKKINLLLLFLAFQSFAQTPSIEVVGDIKVKGTNTVELGNGLTKELDAGKITYGKWTPNTLELVGGGVNNQVRKIKFWNEGGASFVGNLGVGVDNPNEKLAVNGIIQTSQGIKFPDQTVQTTAAISTPAIFPNQNAMPRKQPFALFVTGTNPTITDTLEIVELSGGGILNSMTYLKGSMTAGTSRQAEFTFTINLENAAQAIVQRMSQASSSSKLTLYFPELNSSNYQKAVELRTVYLTSVIFKSNFIGNNQYVNLLELGVAYSQMEVRSVSGSCFCYDFVVGTTCTCD